jgi:putative flippase GtrA
MGADFRMDSIYMIAVKYTFFAVISILVNLLFQHFSFTIYTGHLSLYIAMLTGTVAGLLTKYYLDKKWIFYYEHKDMRDNTEKLTLYTLMGVFTTIIFWGTEIAFDYFIPHPNSKYVGAIIGLSVGYVIKYYLDKKFVFIHREELAS